MADIERINEKQSSDISVARHRKILGQKGRRQFEIAKKSRPSHDFNILTHPHNM